MIVPRRGLLQIHPLNSALTGCGTHSGCPDLDEHIMNLIIRKIILNVLCGVVELPEATCVRDRWMRLLWWVWCVFLVGDWFVAGCLNCDCVVVDFRFGLWTFCFAMLLILISL